jgi:hypothetical protein
MTTERENMIPIVYGFKGAYAFFDAHPWDRCIVERRCWLFWTKRKECGSLGEALVFLGIH